MHVLNHPQSCTHSHNHRHMHKTATHTCIHTHAYVCTPHRHKHMFMHSCTCAHAVSCNHTCNHMHIHMDACETRSINATPYVVVGFSSPVLGTCGRCMNQWWGARNNAAPHRANSAWRYVQTHGLRIHNLPTHCREPYMH